MGTRLSDEQMLDNAQLYADRRSGCRKVKVGACIVNPINKEKTFGANRSRDCKFGCRRKIVFGNDSKEHRTSGECGAVHAEIDALTRAPGYPVNHRVMYCTRYPCEECAKAIVNARYIVKVVYGRETPISPRTEEIFRNAGITVVHSDWIAPDNNS